MENTDLFLTCLGCFHSVNIKGGVFAGVDLEDFYCGPCFDSLFPFSTATGVILPKKEVWQKLDEKEYLRLRRVVKQRVRAEPKRRTYWEAFLTGMYRGYKGRGTGVGELAGLLLFAAGEYSRAEVESGYNDGQAYIEGFKALGKGGK